MKNKKFKIIILVLVMVIVVVSTILCLVFKDNNNVKITENTYIAYVSINPLIKLKFKVSCQNDVCNEPIITDTKLINEDAKEIYKDINFNDKKLNDVVELLSSTARENNINSEYIEVYTDWEDAINYISNNSKDYQYVINHLETEELTNSNFEEELVNDPYIVTEVEIPAALSVKSCDNKTKLVRKSIEEVVVCGPSEYCGAMTPESHPDMWEGPAYACLLIDATGKCIGKLNYTHPIITVTIRTKQSTYDSFKSNKCYELTYDNYCSCKDSYVKAEFNRDNIDEVGIHKVNATIKSSSTIEILPFENGVPYIEFELGINENYEQEQSECLSAGVGTTMPLPSCSE